jgi:hypothetical protein
MSSSRAVPDLTARRLFAFFCGQGRLSGSLGSSPSIQIAQLEGRPSAVKLITVQVRPRLPTSAVPTHPEARRLHHRV